MNSSTNSHWPQPKRNLVSLQKKTNRHAESFDIERTKCTHTFQRTFCVAATCSKFKPQITRYLDENQVSRYPMLSELLFHMCYQVSLTNDRSTRLLLPAHGQIPPKGNPAARNDCLGENNARGSFTRTKVTNRSKKEHFTVQNQ